MVHEVADDVASRVNIVGLNLKTVYVYVDSVVIINIDAGSRGGGPVFGGKDPRTARAKWSAKPGLWVDLIRRQRVLL